MQIEIWSDVVCPWCYIGKRRLESALAGFEHADEVEIVWRSFQLDPDAPREATETIATHLGRKYGGGPEAGRQMIDRVTGIAAGEGLAFDYHDAQRASTVDAHRLLHLALAEGGPALQGELKERLLDAYFVDARNPADRAVLSEAAVAVGLREERVAAVLDSDEYADEVAADAAQAAAYGATGVPFFVVDRRYGVSGAQPSELFGELLERAWADSHPLVQVVGGDDAEACGPDGCAT
ncbi:DsbA family oxidoreductase [Nocardioides sp. GXQ0305]|uniref:DsbA family oxidoreductase n=1 Tax=Nocardioides sp. GXQ0305 TaxID=3423912 RepID=UPI003D7DBC6F